MSDIPVDVKNYHQNVYNVIARFIPPDASEDKPGGGMIRLSNKMHELRVIKQFDTQVMPYVKMTVELSVQEAEMIRASWRQAKVCISIDRLLVPMQGEGTRPIETEDPVWDEVEFRIIETSLDQPPPVAANEDVSATAAKKYRATLELVAVVPLGINKGVSVGSYHNVTVDEVVALMTARVTPTSTPVPYKWWMVPTDNTRQYRSMLIPPQSFVNAIRFVDTTYGMYTGRLNIFLDFQEGFILNSAKVIAPPEGAPTGVMVELRQQAMQAPEVASGSAYNPGDRMYRLRASGNVMVTTEGPGKREADGGHIRVVRTTQRERVGTNCKSLNPESPELKFSGSDTRDKQRVMWQTYDNELTVDRMRNEARANYSTAVVILDAPDMTSLSPLLPWQFAVQGERRAELEGYWRPTAVELVFSTTPAMYNHTPPTDLRAMITLSPAAGKVA